MSESGKPVSNKPVSNKSGSTGAGESAVRRALGDDEHTIRFEHRLTGFPTSIRALKADGMCSYVTKACAQAVGFPTKPLDGQSFATIMPTWTFPGCIASFRNDVFVVLESATHEVLLSNELSLRIQQLLREPPAAAVYSRIESTVAVRSQA